MIFPTAWPPISGPISHKEADVLIEDYHEYVFGTGDTKPTRSIEAIMSKILKIDALLMDTIERERDPVPSLCELIGSADQLKAGWRSQPGQSGLGMSRHTRSALRRSVKITPPILLRLPCGSVAADK